MLANEEDTLRAHIAWARYQAEDNAAQKYPSLPVQPLAIGALVAGLGFAVAAAPALGVWALLVALVFGYAAYGVAKAVNGLRAEARRLEVREMFEARLLRGEP